MKYQYDKERKVLTVDGQGTMILTKNENMVHFDGGFGGENGLRVEFCNHQIYGVAKRVKFKHRLKTSIEVLKFIWKDERK